MFLSEVSRLSDTTRIKTPLCFSRFSSYISPCGNETSNQSQPKQKKQSQRIETLIFRVMTGAHCVYRRQKSFIEMHKVSNVGIESLHKG